MSLLIRKFVANTAIARIRHSLERLTRPHKSVERADERRVARLVSAYYLILIISIPVVATLILFTNQSMGVEKYAVYAWEWAFVPVLLPFFFNSRTKSYLVGYRLWSLLFIVLGFVAVWFVGVPGTELMFIYYLINTLLSSVVLSIGGTAILWLFSVLAIGLYPLTSNRYLPENLDFILYVNVFFGIYVLILSWHRNRVEWDRQSMLSALNDRLLVERNHLSEARARDRAMLSSMNEGLVAVNTKGEITLINQQCLDWLGIQERDAVGHPFVDIFGLDSELLAAGEIESSERKRKRSKVSRVTTTTLRDANDREIPIAVRSSPIHRDRFVVGTVMSIVDQTDTQRLDQAKTNFIATAGHELRTPLTSVKWVMDLLREKSAELPQDVSELLSLAQLKTDEMERLVDKLIKLSKVQSGTISVQKQLFDVNSLIQSLVSELQAKAGETPILIQVLPEAKIMPVLSSQSSLGDILREYLSNAVRFAPGGKIHVRIRRAQPGEQAVIADQSFSLAGQIVIEVVDNGVGVDEQTKASLFGSFIQEGGALHRDQKMGGLGMGLYLVSQIARQIESKVWFESEKGKGSHFFVSVAAGEALPD